jgi:hypothetical protein
MPPDSTRLSPTSTISGAVRRGRKAVTPKVDPDPTFEFGPNEPTKKICHQRRRHQACPAVVALAIAAPALASSSKIISRSAT